MQTIHFNWRQVANGNLITRFLLWKSILRSILLKQGTQRAVNEWYTITWYTGIQTDEHMIFQCAVMPFEKSSAVCALINSVYENWKWKWRAGKISIFVIHFDVWKGIVHSHLKRSTTLYWNGFCLRFASLHSLNTKPNSTRIAFAVATWNIFKTV